MNSNNRNPIQKSSRLRIRQPGARWATLVATLLCSLAATPASSLIWELSHISTPKNTMEVAVEDGIAYVTEQGNWWQSKSLQTIDVSNPESPTHLGSVALSEYAYGVEVSNGIAYVTQSGDYGGLKLFDVSNPAAPVALGRLDLPGGFQSPIPHLHDVYDVHVQGDVAYLAHGIFGVLIADVSDPNQPTTLGYPNWQPSSGLGMGIDVEGEYAFLVADLSGLHVFDISDPSSPNEIGTLATPGDAFRVIADNGIAYVADGSAGVRIIDVSNPATPFELGSLTTMGGAWGIDLVDGILHVSDSGFGLRLFDVSDPTSPVEVDSLAVNNTQGVKVVDGIAHLLEGTYGLTLVHVSQSLIGNLYTPDTATDVEVKDSLAYVADLSGLHIANVSDPSSPLDIGGLGIPGSTTDVELKDGFAYLANSDGLHSGLRVIDIADPSAPVEIGSLYNPGGGGPMDIELLGERAFLADGSSLRVIDISVPAAPVEIGSLNTPLTAQGVAVSGEHVYVADGAAGLRVIDIADPGTPVEIGFLDTPGSAVDVTVAGDLAFVADMDFGLLVVDVSNPAFPVQISNPQTHLRNANDVEVVDEVAYVSYRGSSSTGTGLSLVDVSDPANPVELDTLYLPKGVPANSIEVECHVAYVAAGPLYGLTMLELPGELGCQFDDDGIPNQVELAAPNAGDGNGDGIPDAEQSNVASLPDLGGNNYVTLDASSSCPVLWDVSIAAESMGPGGDPLHDYPFGLVNFTLPCSGPATVKIYFHGTPSLAPPYRKYGPTTPGDMSTLAWYSMPGTVFGTEMVNGNPVATVEFVLTDGELGDSTGLDGLIVDPGGPVPEPGFALSFLSGLAMLRWLTVRRRRME